MQYTHPEYLTSVDELNANLDSSDWRIFDCAVFLTPQATGGYQVDSGFDKYQQSHIPGAGFIDLINKWSDTGSKLNFTLPEPDQLAQAIGEAGIAANHRVVLYSSGHLMWATRAWWLLHYAGHKNVSVLNGNLSAWKKANLPLESGISQYPPTNFTANVQPGAFVDTDTVAGAMHGQVCTINALSEALYEGSGDFYYQRRGHIPGSHSLFFDHLVEEEYFLQPKSLHDALEQHGMLSADRVITYCGGGIAATLDGFACKLMGQDSVAIYDGSMSEWVQDPERPLTVGKQP